VFSETPHVLAGYLHRGLLQSNRQGLDSPMGSLLQRGGGLITGGFVRRNHEEPRIPRAWGDSGI
jgi:hypothetical protein